MGISKYPAITTPQRGYCFANVYSWIRKTVSLQPLRGYRAVVRLNSVPAQARRSLMRRLLSSSTAWHPCAAVTDLSLDELLQCGLVLLLLSQKLLQFGVLRFQQPEALSLASLHPAELRFRAVNSFLGFVLVAGNSRSGGGSYVLLLNRDGPFLDVEFALNSVHSGSG